MLLVILALGVVQGLCEFLPVSSSGHLVLAQALFGLGEPEVLLDLVLHLGTLLAVCVFYRKSLGELIVELRLLPAALFRGKMSEYFRTLPVFRLGILIIVACVPTAVMGLVGRDFLESLFNSTRAVGVSLLITAAVLALTGLAPARGGRRVGTMTLLDAALIGAAQGLAIAPGLSRSGLTIACALFLGLERGLAARFSFLLSIPAIVGGLALSLGSGQTSSAGPGHLFLGLVAAAAVGYKALVFLNAVVDRGRLWAFAPWCVLAGAAAVLSS
ncbi:MAG: undecaprenyl-diphosphate phosphatase [Deltaproteobacteria bacterium]|jgi:undecaprenyl-diphosphatase|nr:undecaprenyl-diphosphate phosphatase [Deltaproteobacteria bacterium]